MERKVSKEVQDAWKLLDAAAAGTLNLDAADADQSSNAAPANAGEPTKEAEPAAVVAPEVEVEGAPIAAKSGGYTIPYKKLADARGLAKTLEEENASLKAQLADLSAQQQANLAAAAADATARANAGQAPTSADQQVSIAQAAIGQGVDPELFGDFSEEAIAKGVKALVDAQVVYRELVLDGLRSMATTRPFTTHTLTLIRFLKARNWRTGRRHSRRSFRRASLPS